MNYTIDQIKKGVATYLDAEFMPVIEGDLKRIMVGGLMSIAISKYANLIPALAENKFIKPLEIIDENGDVDLDTLYAAIQGQVPKDGFAVNIPTVGAMRLKSEDVQKLYNTIKNQK